MTDHLYSPESKPSRDTEKNSEEFIVLGNSLLNERDYENAITAYGEALRIQVDKYGDLHVNCAQSYFLYGKAMVENYRENTGIFSEKKVSPKSEIPFHLKTEENPSGSSPDEEETTDLEIAWENLETARLILDNHHDEFNRNILADVLINLGLIEFESGREENACEEIKKSLQMLEDYRKIDPGHYAHAAYELAMIYTFRNMYKDAQEYYEIARSVLQLHVKKLKENFSLNKEKIDEMNFVVSQLDDKIQDCMACTEDSSTKKEVELIEPKADLPLATASDVTHLVKRKKKNEDDITEEKKVN
uniref:Protein HGV2 (Trinotate prediction) n=1 Tax=Myxobolus squamalis TaxID=59785 RepID=A0A6B2FZS7_MYXSQ